MSSHESTTSLPPHTTDLTGLSFGRWTVLRFAGTVHGASVWTCQCSCPLHTIKDVAATLLRRGKSRSCNCLKNELTATRKDPTTGLPQNTLDLTGQTFGHLHVIAYAGLRKGRAVWTCRCDLDGTIKDIPAKTLRNGTAQSCGCLRIARLQDPTRNPRPATEDLLGRTFGLWTVIAHAGVRKGHTYWTCQCACPLGTIEDIPANRLKRGRANSCGCDTGRLISEANTSHGLCETREYEVWSAMLQRCLNANSPNYDLYGGRGITVCEAWRESFEAFLADMGPRPSDDHSIDRVDNNGPYNRENCRWTTRDEQARNRRTTIWITYNGQTLTATQWEAELASISGVKARNILERLRWQWPVEDALMIPVSPNNNALHRKEKSYYYHQ